MCVARSIRNLRALVDKGLLYSYANTNARRLDILQLRFAKNQTQLLKNTTDNNDASDCGAFETDATERASMMTARISSNAARC